MSLLKVFAPRHRRTVMPRLALVAGACAAVQIGPTLVASVSSTGSGGAAAYVVAAGAIAGTITAPADAGRTAERYVTGTGESRNAASVPVVVFIDGAVPAAGPAPASGRTEIAQQDATFQPGLLVVPVGARVGFPNRDPEFHNVFSYSRAKRFDLGRYRQGETKTVVFDRPGYVKVLCEVHKWMRAGVVVVENPYYAVVSEDGRFRIEAVPPGKYRLVIEHFDKRPHTVAAEVKDQETTRIDVRL